MNTQDLESTQEHRYLGINLPNWLNEFYYNFGGIKIDQITFDSVKTECLPNKLNKLFVFENDFVTQSQYFIDLLESNIIQKLVVYNEHPWKFSTDLLDRVSLNSKIVNRIVFLVNGYYALKNTKFKSYHFDLQEHAISHHFNLLLANKLQNKRAVTKDFIIQVVPKDSYRKTIVDFLKNTKIFDNSITNFESNKTSQQLQDKQKFFVEQCKKKHGNGQYINALDSYGYGLPNLSLYEKVFCEIVIETRNIDSFHFTEKVFRPIALGIPIVFLGSKLMFDTLIENGYRFYGEDFYKSWHTDEPLLDRLLYLQKFLEQLKQDKITRQKMIEIAQHNFNYFWNQRKLNYYQQVYNALDNVSEENSILSKIYKELNF